MRVGRIKQCVRAYVCRRGMGWNGMVWDEVVRAYAIEYKPTSFET